MGREEYYATDNERGKGHHRHYFDEEERIEFKSWDELVRMLKN